MADLTKELIEQYQKSASRAEDHLVEVLCSAYKDATGKLPSDDLRDKLLEAVRYDAA